MLLLYKKANVNILSCNIFYVSGSLQEYLNFLQKNASKNLIICFDKINWIFLKKNLEMGNPKFISCNHANRNVFPPFFNLQEGRQVWKHFFLFLCFWEKGITPNQSFFFLHPLWKICKRTRKMYPILVHPTLDIVTLIVIAVKSQYLMGVCVIHMN